MSLDLNSIQSTPLCSGLICGAYFLSTNVCFCECENYVSFCMISGRNQGRPSVFLSNICVGLCVLILSVRCNMMMGVCTFCSDILLKQLRNALKVRSVLLNGTKRFHYLKKKITLVCEKSCGTDLCPDFFLSENVNISTNKQDKMSAVKLSL